MHGGSKLKEMRNQNPTAVKNGLENLAKHVENIKLFNMPSVVAINRFDNDSDEEIRIVKDFCKDLNVACEIADVHQNGGEGAVALAESVIKSSESNLHYKTILI
jgi:formate--tetrahydrofolate ligase